MSEDKELKKHVCGAYPGDELNFTPIASTPTNPIDYVELVLGTRALLVPFKLLEIWYEIAKEARKYDTRDE